MWNHDAELQALFRDEVSERAHRLIEAGRRMATEGVDLDQISELVRDAHTIKGSARVMGYAAMARAAETLENLWKQIRDGAVAADAGLGDLLAGLASSLEGAAEAHPAEGTPELANALAEADGFRARPAPAPNGGEPAAPAATPQPAPTEPLSPRAVDLGGLLSTLEVEAVEESASIENKKLYRLINRSAEARVDARGLRETVTALRLATAGRPQEVAALAARWERAVEALEQTVDDLQKQAMALAAAPLREVTDAFPRLVRYLARKTDKHVRLEMVGGDVEVDRQVLERLADPLRHLIVNAVEHGIEPSAERAELGKPSTAAVSMSAEVSGGRLRITIEDDGRGVDWQVLEQAARARGLVDGPSSQAELTSFLFLEGMTTRPVRSEFTGDGAGLAVVAQAVEALNGGLELTSVPGTGTRVEVTVPAWWALQEVLLVRAGGHLWGIPEPAVAAGFPISFADLRPGEARMELLWQDQSVPVASLSAAVGLPEEEPVEEVVIVTTRAGLVALTVPEIIGARQIAVKALGPLLQGLPHLTGAAVLNGTDVVVILEPNRLGERVRTLPAVIGPRARVMVVDDSPGVRQLLAATLASHGFETIVAAGVREALGSLESERIDALVVDYSMPGRDGVELVARVRQASPGLPIVMVSAVADADVQARARQAGVDAYFDKSDLRQGALAATLQALVESRALHQAT